MPSDKLDFCAFFNIIGHLIRSGDAIEVKVDDKAIYLKRDYFGYILFYCCYAYLEYIVYEFQHKG
ncbi:hypothetical protein ABCY62_10855 [Acetivibrio clariflavus]